MGCLQAVKRVVSAAIKQEAECAVKQVKKRPRLRDIAQAKIETLPQELQGTAKKTVAVNYMATMTSGIPDIIQMSKKNQLLELFAGKFSPKELRKLKNASSSEELSNAVMDLLNNIQKHSPKEFETWLGIPEVPAKIKKQGFESVRKYIIDSLYGKCSKKEFQQLISAKETKEFNQVLKKIEERKYQSGVPLEIEKIMTDFQQKRSDLCLDVYKIIKNEPQNPKVIEIENILRTKYGIQFVDLADSEEFADKVLKSVELRVKTGKKIPNNIVVTYLLDSTGEAIQHSNLETTVILNKTSAFDIFKTLMKCDAETCGNKQLSDVYENIIEAFDEINKSYLSTSHPLHTVIHEFNHLGQLKLLASRFQKLPEKFRTIWENLSLYASEGIPGEVESELLTKMELEQLTKEEQKLFEYFC